MKVEHRFSITCRCPVNNGTDYYMATVTTDKLLKVEDIAEAVAALTKEPAYQEDLTAALAARLGCKVVTAGWHGHVHTTVSCGEAP